MTRPVLILGAVPRMTTTIARSLHRYGIPVDVATFSPVEPRIRSRAITRFFRIPDPDVSRAAFVADVCKIVTEYGHDMLVPGNDVALTAIVENYDEFTAIVKAACPRPQIVNKILDKSVTLEMARKCGVRVPRMILISDSRQISVVADEIGFPVIVKPSEKRRSETFKVRLVKTGQELQALFPSGSEFSPPLLAQEFCPGVGVGVEVLMHKGECLTAFQHRRIKELPHAGGVAALAISERVDPALLDSSVRLLQALDWEGVAMVEFRVDPASGNFFLMEVNGRLWGSISLPVLAGLDFPLYQWQVFQGLTPDLPDAYKIGMKWRWTAGYLSRLNGLVLARCRGRLHQSVLRELLESRHDFGPSTVDSLWSWNDPVPAISELLRTVSAVAISDMKSLAKGLSGMFFSRQLSATSAKNPAKPAS